MVKTSHAVITTLVVSALLLTMEGTGAVKFLRAHVTMVAKQDMVTICHVPPEPDETLEIPDSALDAHVQHGDYLGPCVSSSSSSSLLSSSSSDESSSEDPAISSSSSSDQESSENSSTDQASSSSQESTDDHTGTHHDAVPEERGESKAGGPSFALFRGHGVAELAATTHFVLVSYGLHESSPYQYTFNHENIRPESFASKDALEEWTLREHEACCSMFRYLLRIRENRPYIKPGYIDWVSDQMAHALGEDPVEIKAALLGQPHVHPHTSDFVRSITEEGCAETSMSRKTGSEKGDENHQYSTHTEHILHSASVKDPLTVEQRDVPSKIAFAIMDGETVFADYGVSHSKEMHLLVVRDDLRHFQHIHPERDAEGVWHVPFVAPAGGRYWMYADFIGKDDEAHTIRFERTFDTDPGESGLKKDATMKKTVGKYVVQLEAAPYEQGILFTFHIHRKRYGDVPHLEEYLGAMGHGILITPDGDFIHTHPSPAGDTLIFHTPTLAHDFYRIFTQFQIDGELLTVEFDWEPPLATPPSVQQRSHQLQKGS